MYGPTEIVAIPAVASPAGIAYPLPGGERTEIEGLCFTLVTSNHVANRRVVARLQDGTGTDVYAVAAPQVQVASETVVYSFAPLVPSDGDSAIGFMTGPFPKMCSGDPLKVVVTVVNADANDVIHSGRLTVKQYPVEPDFVASE